MANSFIYLSPNGSGDYTQIQGQTPDTPGTHHWDKVRDSHTPNQNDGDSTIVYGIGVSHYPLPPTYNKDAYTLETTQVSGTIVSVTVYIDARTAGDMSYYSSIGAGVILNGNEFFVDGEGLGHQYQYGSFSFAMNRPGGGSWTWDDINSMQVIAGICGGQWVFNPYTSINITNVVVVIEYTPPTAFTITLGGDDATSDLRSLSVRRGRQYEMDRIEAGTAVIELDNRSSKYWPDLHANILPWKSVAIQYSYNGTTYDIFHGFAEAWIPDFVLDPDKIPIMKLTCVDFMKGISRCLINKDTGYSQEGSGTRVGHVLDDIGWSSADRVISLDNNYNIQSTDTPTVNLVAIEHIDDIQNADLGLFYMSRDGKAHYEDHSFRTTYRLSPIATFGDEDGDDYRWAEIDMSLDDQRIWNDIRVNYVGNTGPDYVIDNNDSIARYGVRSKDCTGLLLTNGTDCTDLGYMILQKYKDPIMRVKSVTLLPASNVVSGVSTYEEWVASVVQFEISDRVTVKYTPGGINRDFYIEGITHDWNAQQPEMWRTKFDLTDTHADIELRIRAIDTGFCLNTGNDYETVHNALESNYVLSPGDLQVGQLNPYSTPPAKEYAIYRGGVVFPSPNIPDNTEIESMSLWLNIFIDQSETDFDITITSEWGTNDDLVVGDYPTLLTGTIYGTLNTSGISNWVEIPLNSTAIAEINKNDKNRFGVISSRDLTPTEPTDFERIVFHAAYSGYKPMLVVTFHYLAYWVLGTAHLGTDTYLGY